MTPPVVAAIRAYIQEACPRPEDQVSYADIFQAFSLSGEGEKRRLRKKMRAMMNRGELVRVSPGVFTYHPEALGQRYQEGYQRVWRALRSARPGWSWQDLALVTRMSYAMVRNYALWLQDQGYVAPLGRQGVTRLWRATSKAMEQPETPYPPPTPRDRYADQRSAACRLVRCLMERDPGRPVVAAQIVKECHQILERFAGKENVVEYPKDHSSGHGAKGSQKNGGGDHAMNEIQDGYMENSHGHLMTLDLIKEIHVIQHESVM